MIQKITTFIGTSTRFLVLAIFIASVSVNTGCKSKKKAMEAQAAAAEKARLEKEAAEKKQREEEAARKKREAEEAAAAAERARLEAEAKKSTPYTKLEGYFNAISGASSVAAANSSINEALSLFASPETPVLIVISESGGQKDYDRPTTIRDYLNYLKDQKKPADKLGTLQFDGSGKITEVELVKQK
jgi:regulator of protease activity HflC (stomatin/prohibitin superfamily)